MPAAQTKDKILFDGVLEKKGAIWRNRRFVLYDDRLEHYLPDDTKLEKKRGEIRLDRKNTLVAEVAGRGRHQYSFMISTAEGSTTLAATSRSLLGRWVRYLQERIHVYNPPKGGARAYTAGDEKSTSKRVSPAATKGLIPAHTEWSSLSSADKEKARSERKSCPYDSKGAPAKGNNAFTKNNKDKDGDKDGRDGTGNAHQLNGYFFWIPSSFKGPQEREIPHGTAFRFHHRDNDAFVVVNVYEKQLMIEKDCVNLVQSASEAIIRNNMADVEDDEKAKKKKKNRSADDEEQGVDEVRHDLFISQSRPTAKELNAGVKDSSEWYGWSTVASKGNREIASAGLRRMAVPPDAMYAQDIAILYAGPTGKKEDCLDHVRAIVDTCGPSVGESREYDEAAIDRHLRRLDYESIGYGWLANLAVSKNKYPVLSEFMPEAWEFVCAVGQRVAPDQFPKGSKSKKGGTDPWEVIDRLNDVGFSGSASKSSKKDKDGKKGRHKREDSDLHGDIGSMAVIEDDGDARWRRNVSRFLAWALDGGIFPSFNFNTIADTVLDNRKKIAELFKEGAGSSEIKELESENKFMISMLDYCLHLTSGGGHFSRHTTLAEKIQNQQSVADFNLNEGVLERLFSTGFVANVLLRIGFYGVIPLMTTILEKGRSYALKRAVLDTLLVDEVIQENKVRDRLVSYGAPRYILNNLDANNPLADSSLLLLADLTEKIESTRTLLVNGDFVRKLTKLIAKSGTLERLRDACVTLAYCAKTDVCIAPMLDQNAMAFLSDVIHRFVKPNKKVDFRNPKVDYFAKSFEERHETEGRDAIERTRDEQKARDARKKAALEKERKEALAEEEKKKSERKARENAEAESKRGEDKSNKRGEDKSDRRDRGQDKSDNRGEDKKGSDSDKKESIGAPPIVGKQSDESDKSEALRRAQSGSGDLYVEQIIVEYALSAVKSLVRPATESVKERLMHDINGPTMTPKGVSLFIASRLHKRVCAVLGETFRPPSLLAEAALICATLVQYDQSRKALLSENAIRRLVDLAHTSVDFTVLEAVWLALSALARSNDTHTEMVEHGVVEAVVYLPFTYYSEMPRGINGARAVRSALKLNNKFDEKRASDASSRSRSRSRSRSDVGRDSKKEKKDRDSKDKDRDSKDKDERRVKSERSGRDREDRDRSRERKSNRV